MTENKNVKTVVDALVTSAVAVAKVFEDKKVTLMEIVGLVPTLTQDALAVQALPAAKTEIVSADDESREDIATYAKSKLSFSNDHTNEEVYHAVVILIYAAAFFAPKAA